MALPQTSALTFDWAWSSTATFSARRANEKERRKKNTSTASAFLSQTQTLVDTGTLSARPVNHSEPWPFAEVKLQPQINHLALVRRSIINNCIFGLLKNSFILKKTSLPILSVVCYFNFRRAITTTLTQTPKNTTHTWKLFLRRAERRLCNHFQIHPFCYKISRNPTFKEHSWENLTIPQQTAITRDVLITFETRSEPLCTNKMRKQIAAIRDALNSTAIFSPDHSS